MKALCATEVNPQGRALAWWPLIAAFAVLAVLCAVYFAWPVWRAYFPLEIDTNEPWNAYHADAVASGQVLYPAATSLVGNNYPPLSFYLVAALAAGTFDALYVGRMLSIAATLAISLAVMVLVRQLAASRAAAVLAGLWFLATLARFFAPYVGMNDPNLLALAIMSWALVWLMRRLAAGRAVEPAILLMAVAGFFKHNVMAIPLTAFVWLGYIDRRQAVRAAAVGVAAVALGLAICGLAWGNAFFAQLFMPRGLDLAHLWGGLGRLQWIAPALAIVVIWIPYDWQNPAARFAAALVASAFALHCVEKLGDGVADNAQFELVAATAVGIGVAFDRVEATPAARRWGIDGCRLAIVAVLVARLLASMNTVPYRVIVSPAFRALLHERRGSAGGGRPHPGDPGAGRLLDRDGVPHGRQAAVDRCLHGRAAASLRPADAA